MKTILLKILLLSVFVSSSVFAQQSANKDILLDHMIGNWVLKGIIGGQETTHDINIEWVLGHQYVQISEVSRDKDPGGKPLYEAIVFISRDEPLKQYNCLWLDNTGNGGLSAQAIGHAKENGDLIEFLFKLTGSTFHTSFIYEKSSDSWQWLMDEEQNGIFQPFARVKLTRKEI